MRPRKVLTGSVAVVGLSAALLPTLPIYPTIFEYTVALFAWGIISYAKSPHFADFHFPLVWSVTVLLHVIAFSIPALAVWFGFRNRRPRLCSGLLAAWCLIYLMLVLFLFPASGGA